MAEGKRRRNTGLALGVSLLLFVAGAAARKYSVPAKVRSRLRKGRHS
jgi:hypothetical protein